MPPHVNEVKRLISHWQLPPGCTGYLPLVPVYRYPSQELIRSLIAESNTLNKLGLVGWAEELLGGDTTELIAIERFFIRRATIEYKSDAKEVYFNGHLVSYVSVVKALVMAIAFYDGSHRIKCNSIMGRKIGFVFKKLVSALVLLLSKYLTRVKV